MDCKCVLVTGGSGLLGANIIKELLQNSSARIIVLMRNPVKKRRDKLSHDILAFNGGSRTGISPDQRIEIVEGDVTLPDLGIAPAIKSGLLQEIDIIYHCAAVIKMSGAEAEVTTTNVTGTKNVLDFAFQCKEKGRLEKVIHVSTIAVAGDRKDVIYENDLDFGQRFNNPYEKSKFEAEKLVQDYRKRGLNILIVRPSMVIGHSQNGFTNHFNIFYFQLRLLAEGIFGTLPLHEKAAYNLVPVDYAARAICLVSVSKNIHNKNFHIVNTNEVEVRQFVEKTCAYLGYAFPEFVTVSDTCPLPSAAFEGVRGKVLGIYYPYISSKKAFDASNANEALRSHDFAWPCVNDSLLEKILDFCISSGYLHLKRAGAQAASHQ